MLNRKTARFTRLVAVMLAIAVIAPFVAVPVQRTADAAAPIELISNGSFETGNFSGWQIQTTGFPFSPWQVVGAGFKTWPTFAATAPQQGIRQAVNGFDGGGPMQFRMWQDVSIPNGTASISWKHRLQWDFRPGSFASIPRTLTVQLRNPSTNAVLATLFTFSTGTQATNPTGNTGWVNPSANISAFAGQSVRVFFEENIPQSFTGPAMAEFDAVSLIAIPNDPPNCSQAAPSVSTIWPPNHNLVPVNILGVTDPDNDPITINIDGITQDEPVNGLGDGDTGPDGAGVGTSTAQVRAERAGNGNGRVYHISFTASDGQGGSCAGSVTVSVPHDQRKGGAAVDDGAYVDSTTPS